MSSSWKKMLKALTVPLALVIMQVYVLAIPATSSDTAPKPSASKLMFGRLSTLGIEKVAVNGSPVASGTTILSDSQLTTPEKSGAVVDLGSAGKLEIAPKTDLTVSFDQKSIHVNVLGGDALLTTNPGVKGALTSPNAKTQLTDGRNIASIGTALYAADADAAPATGKKCKIGDMPCWLFWTLVGGGAAAAIIIIAVTQGNNPSNTR